MNRATIIALYAVAGVVMLGLIELLLHFTLAYNFAAQQDETQPPAELLRCLVLYGQRMLIVASLSIDWPASIAYPIHALAWVWSSSSPETLSADCILPAGSSMPLSVQRVVFYLCMPIAMLLVLLVLETLLHTRCCYIRRRVTAMGGTPSRLLPRLGSTAMVVLFFFMPSLLRTLFGLFACIPLDQPTAWPYVSSAIGSYWVYDTSNVCFSAGWHRSLALGAGVPLIVLLCICLPATIVYVTLSNLSGLGDITFRRNWGFLTQSYRPRFCWWEAVVLWETAVLVAISVFGVNVGPFFQCAIMIATLILISNMQLGFKPFVHTQTGRAMVQGTHCLLLTTLVGLTFLPYGPVMPGTAYGLAMGGILLVVNVVYVSSVLWQLLRLIDWPVVGKAISKSTSAVRRSIQHVGVIVQHARMRLLARHSASPHAGKAASGGGARGPWPVSKHACSPV
jgi:hypothetical protein